MVSKVVGNLRLVFVGIALLGAQTASAGLMLTSKKLQDFHFNEMTVEYNPDYRSVGAPEDDDPGYSGRAAVPGTAQSRVGDLYLTETMTDDGSLHGAFEVAGKLGPADKPSVLLAGSLEQIQVDRGAGYFGFLTQENSVSADSAREYFDKGVQVSFRVTRLGGVGLVDSFGTPGPVASLLDQPSSQNMTPSIPVPGTFALLAIAGLPLAAARRRRR